jgi:hypothetical protein
MMKLPFISIGAILPILLKKETIERDQTIRLLNNNTFEKYADIIKGKLRTYEEKLIGQKAEEKEKRESYIRSLIEKKRGSKKPPDTTS